VIAGLCAGLMLSAIREDGQGVHARQRGKQADTSPLTQTAPVTIDFEDITTNGLGQGGQAVLTNQYASRGVIFNRVVVLDYAKGQPVDGFAHSGTRAIEQCYAIEFCTLPIEARFRIPQTRVRVWVGYSSPRHGAGSIMLVGYDASGTAIVRKAVDLPASLSPTPIRQVLEVSVTEPRIQSINVMALAQLGPRGLAVDDLEFATTSARPPPPPPPPPKKPPEEPPVVLSVKVVSSPVVAGEAAKFAVSAVGGPLPRFGFNPGDGSERRTLDVEVFRHTYNTPATGVTASVAPADAAGPEVTVAFDVEAPPPAPIALSLALSSTDVVAGQPASFEVSVQGGGAPPAYVLNAGDGSAEETRRDATFTHVFDRAGQYSVSVRLLPGVAGTGATAQVNVSAARAFWIYAAVALIAVVGAYVGWRAMKGRQTPTPTVVTLHPRQRLPPRFDPDTPPGVDLEVRLVKNLARMRFTPRVFLNPGFGVDRRD
jgi:hypothetical protein